MTDPKVKYDFEANVTGAAEVAKMAGALEGLGTAIDPSLATRANAAATALRAIGEEQSAISSFTRVSEASAQAATRLEEAKVKLAQFRTDLSQLTAPTQRQTIQLQRLEEAVQRAGVEAGTQATKLEQAREGLQKYGITADTLTSRSEALADQLKAVRTEADQLGQVSSAAKAFQDQTAGVERYRMALVAAEADLESFRAEMDSTGEPTAAQQRRLQALTATTRQAQIAFQEQSQAQAQATTALRAMGVDTDRLVASQRGAAASSAQAAAAGRSVAAAYGEQGRAAEVSAAQQQRANANVSESLRGISGSLASIKNAAAAVLGGQLLGGMAGDVTKVADAYDNLAARIRLVTGAGPEFDQAFEGVFDVATRTNSALESTGTLFARIADAGKAIGLSNRDALALTETINQAVQVSGASAEASDAAITQLIQGLQSGVLRGEEFNSVMEQAPRLAQAMADGLGVTKGQLRDLAQTGQLTTQTLITALQSQRRVVEKEFGALPTTVGRSITNLQTAWTKFIGETNSGTGATTAIADGINAVARNLDEVAAAAARAGAVLVAALAVDGARALRLFIVEGRAAAVTATALSASLGSIPKMVSITIAAVGFEVGYQIGEMLRENSETARQVGVAIAGFMRATINDLQLLKESAEAIFTSDTVGAAFDRYKQRAQDLDDTFNVLWEEAKKSPAEVAAAAEQAGSAAERMGERGSAAAAAVAGGAGQAAAGVGGIGSQAALAKDALMALGQAAGVSLPGVGASAQDVAKRLLDVVANGGKAAEVFDRDLPAAIEKLSGAELQRFTAAVSNALQQAIRDARKLAEELQGAGKNGDKELAKADDAARRLQKTLEAAGNQAGKSLGVDMAAASGTVSAEFIKAQDNLAALIKSLPQLKAAGVDTGQVVGQALAGMIDGAKNQAEIDAIVNRIGALGKAGEITGPVLAGALKQAADKAVELRQKVEEATPGLQGLGEAARKAGVDFDSLTKGVDKGFADSVKSLSDLSTELNRAGITAEQAGPQLTKALDQRIAAASTKQELDLVVAVVEKMRGSFQLTGPAAEAALEKIRIKAEEVKNAANGVSEAWRLLGVDISKSAEVSSTKMIEAYERAKASGKGSADQLRQAFTALAESVVKANDGIVPEWLKVEAAARGVTVEVDKTGKAIVQAFGSGADAVDRFQGSVRQAADAVDSLTAARERANAEAERVLAAQEKEIELQERAIALQNKKWNRDAQGFSVNPTTGERINMAVPTQEGIFSMLKQTGLDDAQAAQVLKDFQVDGNNLSYRGQSSRVANLPDWVSKVNAAGSEQVLRLAQQPTNTSTAASSSTTQTQKHVVELKLNGTTTTVNTSSASDAEMLANFMKQLQTAAGVAQ